MPRILVVDDEQRIREIIKKYAAFEGYDIREAEDGMQAVEIAEKEDFDLIIMDIMMPGLDGFSACKEIRKKKEVPVIMLSARGEEYDRIHGFETGADDYVVKPFSPRELMMRVAAVLKRANPQQQAGHEVYQSGGLKVDFTGRLVEIDGERVELSPKEYDLLFYLVKNRNIALTRENLITNVWGYDFYGDDRTLDTHIKLLEVDEYKEKYHEYLRQIVDEYFYSGYFEKAIDRINTLITKAVATDPTAFYSYDEYTAAVEALKVYGKLRAESIKGQLDGTVPSTQEAQQADPEALIDASAVDLSALGQQAQDQTDWKSTALLLGISGILLIGGVVFAFCFRRRR